MTHSKSIFAAVLISAMFLGACAKKDSEFAAKYQKNKLGADVADGVQTEEAADHAANYGLKEADIVNIQKTTSNGAQVVTSTILIESDVGGVPTVTQMPVTTMHTGLGIAEGKVVINGYTVAFHAVCGNYTCNPYYAALEVYSPNGNMIIQEGLRKGFDGIQGFDKYQKLIPTKSVPLIGGKTFSADDLYSAQVMVGILSGKTPGSSSGLVK